MSTSNPSVSGRRSVDIGVLARQDSSAADGPFSPAGLKVLVVDDDPMCLKVVSAMLRRCNYQVVTQSNGQEALALLRQRQEEGNDQFDLVLSDVYMPDMDGFRLMEAIALELDLPVIMMSSDGDTNVVLRGVTHGAVDFLIKPVRIEELRNVWQHVVRRRSIQVGRTGDDSAIDCDGDSRTHGTKRKETETLRAEHESASGNKKPRVVWSVEMHQQFVNAVNMLGIDKAVPKRILDLMNVEGLTRENVASHLQKYRLYLKRVEGVQNGKGGRVPKPPVVERLAAAAEAQAEVATQLAMPQAQPQMDLQQQHSAGGAPIVAAQQSQQPQPGMPAAPMAPPQQAQQAIPMAVVSSGYGNPAAMMGMANPVAAAHMAAAWQQQTMAMQAAVAATAASGALPAPPMAHMQPGYMPHPGMMPPGYQPMHPMAAPGAPYCPPSTAPPASTAAMPPVSAQMNPSYPGSHNSLASTMQYHHHAGSTTAMGAVTNGNGTHGTANTHHHHHHHHHPMTASGNGNNGITNGGAGGSSTHGGDPAPLPPTSMTVPVAPVEYQSHDDDALLPSLGDGGGMPEEAPLSESLLHDLPVKHETDQEFFSIFNIQHAGDGAAAGK